MGGGPYDDYDWDELPKNIQAAATVLGYNKKMWDKEQPAPYDDYDWDELPANVKQAAGTLGYNQATWDAD